MRDVAVIGVGMQKWGELWAKSLRDIFVESALLAMDDAGVDSLEAMYVGCMTSGLFSAQEHLGSVMADYLGQRHIPSTRVESACASGGLAFRLAWMDVASGTHDVVLAGGVEKMTDISGGDATRALATAADLHWEGVSGVTFPGPVRDDGRRPHGQVRNDPRAARQRGRQEPRQRKQERAGPVPHEDHRRRGDRFGQSG